ncbi:hypothetical protein ACQP25_44595 (plasmid) [Microtetraspora malaysiensis]|uniref:hypothetical protein n=1 Tax=Microtetraspora malaysiensis TaxID=161358 RepID=UPI003D8DCA2B
MPKATTPEPIDWELIFRETDRIQERDRADLARDLMADKDTEQATDAITDVLRSLPSEIWPQILNAAALNAYEERYDNTRAGRTVSVTIAIQEP